MLHLRLALLSTVCLLPLAAAPALAARAGVTAAVNQSASGTPPGGGIRTIVLGQDVLQDEKIDTTGKGLVQILLADGTTFTVGPNSSLTIDHFVYDPSAGTAQVTASLAKGVFRFIGGRTSKTPNGVTLDTPVGTVGIRGAVVDINLVPTADGRRAQIDLLFGLEVTLDRQRIYQPGYSIIVGRDGQLRIVKTPPGSSDLIQLILTGHPGQTGGSHRIPTDQTVASSGVPPTNSGYPVHDNTPPPPLPLPTTDFGDTITTVVDNSNGDTTRDAVPPPNTPPADTRYSGTFEGFSAGVGSGYVEGSGGGSNPYGPILLQSSSDPSDTTIDFNPSANSVDGSITNSSVDDYSHTLNSVSVGFGSTHGGTSSFDSNDSYGATGPSSSASADLEYKSTGSPGSGGTGTTVTGGISGFAPCTCAYMQWGSWATDFNAQGQYGTPSQGHVTVDNGVWVTGNIPSNAAFDTYSASQVGITATYTGQATGNWTLGSQSGTATGGMTMTYDLGVRSGELDINNFDGKNFSTDVDGSGSGPLFSGSSEGGLSVNGAFTSNGTDLAHGAIGNFTASSGDWNATGIFAGQVTSTAQSPGN